MNIIEESFRKLYPDREFNYSCSLKYSGQFKPYNANIKYGYGCVELKLSRDWKKIDKEIKIGLIQSLMKKLWKTKNSTMNIDFYNNFLKKVHLITPKIKSDPVLDASFVRVNERYFGGFIEKPNLEWGGESFRKLGSYDLQGDVISISAVFKKGDICLLDYVMYHEMLHKKHKFVNRGGRSYFHTSKFRKAEKEFEDAEGMEKEINLFLRRVKRKKGFWGLFD